ncbi:hypothetical protein BP6252_12211 [Coleophoma cylindrospora]|uniref:Uncharacterized protein n=1 Tax=Coleophoma cylindrospora TaxID=1849047 RepID=A0A3D8QGL1_9HELO|nr:hypothetical protein BP6252_12211 [Coleophoma cylindrospora]
MAHLELLFHFCTSTSYSLSSGEASKLLWQTTVVQIALKYDYLMQGLLSITSFHLAFLKPAQRDHYISQALDLHHSALAKGVPALSNITAENTEAVYMFSMLTFVFSFARPRGPDDALLGRGSNLGEWLVMFRGLRTVVESLDMSILTAGPIGPMLLIGSRRTAYHHSVSIQVDHLWTLQRFINESTCDTDERQTYSKTIDQLRVSYNVVYSPESAECYSIGPPEATDSFVWLYRLSDHFLKLLGEKKQESLAILAYFCVLLKRHDAVWWVHGWSEHLISQIHQRLDEEHRLWINWPIREIGWLPPS